MAHFKGLSPFLCSCHRSHFDPNGNVTHGPDVKDLKTLCIEMTEENNLILHTD
jgi:Rieske Fe-S protein